jgi:tripartite-type tricarboxylate transporter receptor subunit TctC
VRVVVPSSPGGIIDLVTRLVAQQMSAQTGQPVVVENRAGATTNIGTEAVARAAPDGYTVLSTTLTLVVNPSMFPQLSFSAERDFAPVSMLVAAPYAIVVHPAVPAKDIRSFVALARAHPGKLNYASGGSGTNFHVSAELLQYHTGMRLAHVPYKGGGPALASVLGGETDMTIPSLAAALPHMRSGRVRALAITTAQRSPLVPELPTVAESGVPEYAFSSWVGMLLPAGTPASIVAALHDQAVKAVRSREVGGRLAADGTQIVAGSPAEFADYIRREIPRWAQVVKARGIVAQ